MPLNRSTERRIRACPAAETFVARIDGHQVVVEHVVTGYLCKISRDGFSAELPELIVTGHLTNCNAAESLEVERETVVEINEWAASKGVPTEDLRRRKGRPRLRAADAKAA